MGMHAVTTVPRIPVDSADAAELRDAAEELAAIEARHRARCVGGWLGEDVDGRPIPCLRCKPHLDTRDCRACATGLTVCEQLQDRGTRCCDSCGHPPATRLADLLDALDRRVAEEARA